MDDIWLPIAIMVAWFVFNAWVLPKSGVST